MSASKATLLTLIAGLLFWSSWIPSSRMAAPKGAAIPPSQWHKTPAPARRSSPEERFKRSVRLGDVVRDPKSLTRSDLERAKADWGPDAPRMLSVLKQAQ
jgi:hypothetical protein